MTGGKERDLLPKVAAVASRRELPESICWACAPHHNDNDKDSDACLWQLLHGARTLEETMRQKEESERNKQLFMAFSHHEIR